MLRQRRKGTHERTCALASTAQGGSTRQEARQRTRQSHADAQDADSADDGRKDAAEVLSASGSPEVGFLVWVRAEHARESKRRASNGVCHAQWTLDAFEGALMLPL